MNCTKSWKLAFPQSPNPSAFLLRSAHPVHPVHPFDPTYSNLCSMTCRGNHHCETIPPLHLFQRCVKWICHSLLDGIGKICRSSLSMVFHFLVIYDLFDFCVCCRIVCWKSRRICKNPTMMSVDRIIMLCNRHETRREYVVHARLYFFQNLDYQTRY